MSELEPKLYGRPEKEILMIPAARGGKGAKTSTYKQKYTVELKWEMVIAQLRLIFVLPLVID